MKAETLSVSKFKATCLSVIDRVKKTGKPVTITKFGKPVAQLVPPPAKSLNRRDWLGSMKGRGRITGDIVGPTFPQWEE
ncbi:MAG TPA: type II toxin-antitoxin system prevent-host-death family antitoxin, partial [Candidatus Binataceae bacterium]